MLKMPIDDILNKIKSEKGLSEEQIEEKIKAKMGQLAGLISREGAAHIIANELGVKLFEQISGKVKVDKILEGMRDIEVVGKVVQIFDVRTFTRKDGTPSKVGSFVVGDETGTIRIVCWGDKAEILSELKQDGVVKISNTYVKNNQGRIELHANDNTKVLLDPPGETVGEVKASPQSGGAPRTAKRKNIKSLEPNENGVELFGTVVQVFDPRFYEVCPNCNKRIRETEGAFICPEHSQVAPKYAYFVSLFLDDGSDNIRCIFFRDQALKLLKVDDPGMLKFKSSPEVFEDTKTDLLGNMIKIQGRVQKNDMFDRLEFVAFDVKEADPEEEIKHLEATQ